MEDRCYAPFPTSMFVQLDRIRELTKDSEILSEPEFVAVKRPRSADNSGEEEEEEVKMENATSQPSKKQKRLSRHVMGECPPSRVLENNELTKILSFNELESVLNKNFASENNDKMLQTCEKTLVPSCVQHKTKSASLCNSLMALIGKLPTSAIIFATGLVKEIEFESFVQKVIEKDLLTETQERTLLEKWIHNNTISGTSPIFDAVTSRQPHILEDNHFMEMVSRNMINNLSPLKDKCPKFSKFLLQIITKVPLKLSELVYNNLKSLVDSNKTFLKKRMDQELERKCH